MIKEKKLISDKIQKEEDILNKTKENKEMLLSNMEKALREMGTCPICHSNVDDKHINEIISSYR